MSYWSSTCNDPSLIKDFAAELSLDFKSTGSWATDYVHYQEKFAFIPCPFYLFDASQQSVKLLHREIDLISWRAMLLACAVNGSCISEICVNNVQLSSQHITDLMLALDKMGKLEVLKLDYLTILTDPDALKVPDGSAAASVNGHSNSNAAQGAHNAHVGKNTHNQIKEKINETSTSKPKPISILSLILSSNCAIDYISLRGNGLNDEFISHNITSLTNNFTLRALNLSNNIITDLGALQLFQCIKTQHSIRYLSLGHNDIAGSDSLSELATIIAGSIASPEIDVVVQTVTKSIQEKNKSIKVSNIKRKKLNLSELNEVSSYSEHRYFKSDKKGPNVIINRALREIDLSFNPVHHPSVLIMANLMQEKYQELQACQALADPCAINIALNGIFSEDADIEAIQSLSLLNGVTVRC